MRTVRTGAAGAALALLAGCGPSPLTAPALQRSLAGTFARLYVLHEVRAGRPAPGPETLHTTATCQKGTAAVRQSGAGNDWACQVTYLVDGPGTPVQARYDVDLHTDGCWAADGDGPASVNGSRSITGPAGQLRVDPLHLVNGCFDAG